MRATLVLPGVLVVLLLAGCRSNEDIQWMKVGQPYSSADFRTDVAACSKARQLDAACMRDRGWVSVTTPKTPEKSRDLLNAPSNY